jgi:hypothetical protein
MCFCHRQIWICKKNEKLKISQCVGTFPWYNRKVAGTSKSAVPNTQMHDSKTNMNMLNNKRLKISHCVGTFP